jgi:aconitate hydratase
VPQVVGFQLSGKLPEGSTATDLVLTVTEMLRKRGVVGKFVEFFGPGMAGLSVADRATIANMAPEYGATCGIFPIDQRTLEYLRLSGRSDEQVALVEAYLREQGLFATGKEPQARYSDVLTLDLAGVEPSLAGPRRPQDRIPLRAMKPSFERDLGSMLAGAKPAKSAAAGASPGASMGVQTAPALVKFQGESFELRHGSVVIAAITSCTNTSNPSVMIAAGLVAKKANELGLQSRPWVKTSLAPGSKVVTEYLRDSGLLAELEKQGFFVVGYGCTTCIGNSGPLPVPIQEAIDSGNLAVASVLSGNRNFEGRVHTAVRMSYLASPPLVVAYALAGRVDFDPLSEPLGQGRGGKPVFLRDVWPSALEIEQVVQRTVRRELFASNYASVFEGPEEWRSLDVPGGDTYAWEADSTYVRQVPFFANLDAARSPLDSIRDARCLALLGDSVTTDHISPAGSIQKKGPAGRYLIEHGVAPDDFNSYGARRGNHEVMMRGTFANVRLKNLLLPGVEGGETMHLPSEERMSIYDAAMRYADEGVPLVILAGKEYGSGSSRDWAAKGPMLLGVRAVIVQSFERIHRSNLVGMGIAPLQFVDGESAASLGLTGREVFEIESPIERASDGFRAKRKVSVRASAIGRKPIEFQALVRIDTPQEVEYYRHGGILQYVLRRLAG